jgi:thiol-disulfide isomerase/thioredoxin
MIVPGRPAIVIAFASWCAACVAEMPRNVQDYAHYGDRVTFMGIDYVDTATGADAMIAKFAIPFPVERLGVGGAGAAFALHGVTPETLADVLPSMQSQLPGVYPALVDIAAHCTALSEIECIAYAHSKGVDLDTSGHIVAPPANAAASVSLPATFVIDARGVVVQRIEGYDDGADAIAAALAKLGIR